MGNDFKIPTPEERRKFVHDYAYGKTDKVDIEEARYDNAMRVIVALQLALGDETDDVPTWEQLRDRLVSKIAALKAPTASMCNEELEELRAELEQLREFKRVVMANFADIYARSRTDSFFALPACDCERCTTTRTGQTKYE